MPEPTKIPRPFADSGDKNSIPDSSGGLGFASWQEGFPAITGTPFSQGGVAPKRADFNGIFNALSLATVWQQQGGFYAYDNTTDYEVGNVVEYNNDLYKCITANGPGSAVKAPTDTTVWDKVMTLADAAALKIETNINNTTAYYRLSNGLQILTGTGNSLSSGPVHINFSHAFAANPRVAITAGGSSTTLFAPKADNISKTGFDLYDIGVNGYINNAFNYWIAFGIGA